MLKEGNARGGNGIVERQGRVKKWTQLVVAIVELGLFTCSLYHRFDRVGYYFHIKC